MKIYNYFLELKYKYSYSQIVIKIFQNFIL